MKPRRITRAGWLVLGLFVLAASGLPARTQSHAEDHAAHSSGGVGVRLLDAPASAAGDPRARLYIVDHLAPGTVISRRIEVTNTTAAPAAIVLYAAGASITGGSFLGDAGDTQNELSSWNSVQPSTMNLDAGDRGNATVTITVPADASPGERYAVVWAEVRSGPADGSGIEQVNRVGIRQYLSVGPGGAPAADFTIDALTARRSADSSPAVLATVHNTGGRALDLSGELELLEGPGGLRAGPFPASLVSTLGIDDRGQVTIALDERIPAGPWEAQITLRSGLLERSAKATITFPSSGSAEPVPATPTDGGWRFLIPAGLLLVLVIALILGAKVWRTRRSRKRPPSETSSLAAEPRPREARG